MPSEMPRTSNTKAHHFEQEVVYDPTTDIAYVYLSGDYYGEHNDRTHLRRLHTTAGIALDFDHTGRLIGLQIHRGLEVLPPPLMIRAKRPDPTIHHRRPVHAKVP